MNYLICFLVFILMNKKVIAIEIGNEKTKSIAVSKGEQDFIDIVGTVEEGTEGISNSSFVDKGKIKDTIYKTLSRLENIIDDEISNIYLSISGSHLKSQLIRIDVPITSGTITNEDIERANNMLDEKFHQISRNEEIIFVSEILYEFEGYKSNISPIGLDAEELYITFFIVTCFSQHYNNIEQIFSRDDLGLEIHNYLPTPIATGNVATSQIEKEAGCVLIDIGKSTTSILVYEKSKPIYLKVLNIGGVDITKKIAVAFKISIEEAEKMKKNTYLKPMDQKKIDTIVMKVLSDIFNEVDKELKKIELNQLLAGGAIICGGSSIYKGIEDIAKNTLKIPTRMGDKLYGQEININPSFSGVYGTAIWAVEDGEEDVSIWKSIKNKFKKVNR